MSRHAKLLSAAFLLSALPLLFACDNPTGPEEQFIRVYPASTTLYVGQWLKFSATVNGPAAMGGDNEVRWSSSNTAVASVSKDGIVVAKAPGITTIRAGCNGYCGAARVTVKYGSGEWEEMGSDGEE